MSSVQNENEKYSFIEKTIIDNFLQLARVNLVTGEYEFLKENSEINADPADNDDIYKYIQRLATDRYVSHDYIEGLRRFSEPEYVRKRIFGGERKVVFRYKRKLPCGGSRWVIFSIYAPENCSPEDPWVVFSLMDSDAGTTALTMAMSALSVIYHKILNIDLDNDSFEIVKADDDEKPDAGIKTITGWWKRFAEDGNVHEEDLDVYYSFTDPEKIKQHFRTKRTRLSCRYRRRSAEGGYRWAQMDLLPCADCHENEIRLTLFVKDVHEEHLAELHHREELIDNFNRDALTMLYNRRAFQNDQEKISLDSELVSCLYIDVNGLHELNNLLGHQKGDDMLCTVADTLKNFFPDEKVYRIGGDEFVMLSRHLSENSIDRVVCEVRKFLSQSNYEISVGTASGVGSAVTKVIGAAELAMRRDKEEYYNKNSHERTKRVMNEQLEQLIAEKQDEDFFLSHISGRYAGVYYVDLKADSIRYIYITEYFKTMLKSTSFSFFNAINMYADKYVESEYYDNFKRYCDPQRLSNILSEEEKIEFIYRKVNKVYMKLTIIKVHHKGGSKNETLWVFKEDEGRSDT